MEPDNQIETLKSLLAKNRTDEVLTLLMNLSKEINLEYHNEVLSLYTQFNDFSTKKRLNLPYDREAQHKLNYSIIQSIDRLKTCLVDKDTINSLTKNTEELIEEVKEEEKKAKIKISISISIGAFLLIVLSIQMSISATIMLIFGLLILSFIYTKLDDIL